MSRVNRKKIPLIALKEIVLANKVYSSFGLRKMNDIDFLALAGRRRLDGCPLVKKKFSFSMKITGWATGHQDMADTNCPAKSLTGNLWGDKIS